MTANSVLTHGDGTPKDCIHTNLLKGRGPIRDLYDANIEQLLEAGLLRLPRIDGGERTQIIYKPYFVLTPEATDCIDRRTVGSNVGDLGETVTHAIGARLNGQYMRWRVPRETRLEVSVQYYDDLILDDHVVDVAVLVYPPGESHNRRLFAVGEIKTVLSGDSEAINSSATSHRCSG